MTAPSLAPRRSALTRLSFAVALGGVAPMPWRDDAADAELPRGSQAVAGRLFADARPTDHNAFKLPLDPMKAVVPLAELARLLRRGYAERHGGNVARTVLWIRRIAIVCLAAIAYGYYSVSGADTTAMVKVVARLLQAEPFQCRPKSLKAISKPLM